VNESNIKTCFLSLLIIISFSGSVFVKAQDQKKYSSSILPSGSEEAVPFGAYYTKLTYTPDWDKLWPAGDNADVVIRFDNKEPRFVFWRGTSYIPCWASYNGAWFTNEFFERGGGPKSGTTSMVEPMSDKQCRYSNVRIIENTEARVVIHWRYAPVDLEYTQAFKDGETNWGDWADEIYILYPDAVGIRKATIHTSALSEWIEYQESIVVNQPGTFPENSLYFDAVTLFNLKGESKTYTWMEDGGPGLKNPPEQVCIQKINLKSEYKPFTVVNPENVTVQSYRGHAPGSHFNFWNHWPVSQTKSDTRAATSSEKPSHSSLSQIKWDPFGEDATSRTWIMMLGMTNGNDKQLVSLANSWINPPKLKMLTKSFVNKGYDKSQRAYTISSLEISKSPQLKFEIKASELSPVENPAFIIKNWKNKNVSLSINGKKINRGEKFRYGFVNRTDGTDLIIWIKYNAQEKITFSISS
jgi:hypothetical protein